MYTTPVVHAEGNEVKDDEALVSLTHPLFASRKRTVPLCVPRIAIQYLVPVVTATALIEIAFHALGTS